MLRGLRWVWSLERDQGWKSKFRHCLGFFYKKSWDYNWDNVDWKKEELKITHLWCIITVGKMRKFQERRQRQSCPMWQENQEKCHQGKALQEWKKGQWYQMLLISRERWRVETNHWTRKQIKKKTKNPQPQDTGGPPRWSNIYAIISLKKKQKKVGLRKYSKK